MSEHMHLHGQYAIHIYYYIYTIYCHINTISTDFDLTGRVIHCILYTNMESD